MPLTEDQRKRLKLEYMLTPSVRALAREFNVDEGTLRRAARTLGLRRPRKADPEERARRIKEAFPTADIPTLAKELGITVASLRQHAYRLGVHRAEDVKYEQRLRGGLKSAELRRQKAAQALHEELNGKKALQRRLRATPLDAAWRGLME